MSGPFDRWHIAICKPGQDHIAERHLRERRYRVFRPTMPGTKRTRWGYDVPAEKPMFPGYLFVQQNGNGWEWLRAAPGIIRGDRALLKYGNTLVTLGDDDTDFLLIGKTCDRIWDEHNGKPECPFKPGDVVRISAEPWIDFLAVIERVDSNHRIAALIDMLGRKVRVYPKVEHLSLV